MKINEVVPFGKPRFEEPFDQYAPHDLADPQHPSITQIKSFEQLADIIKANCKTMLQAYQTSDLVLCRGMGTNKQVVATNIRPDRLPVEMERDAHVALHQAFLGAGLKATRSNSIFCSSSYAISNNWGWGVYIIFVRDGWTGTVFSNIKKDYAYYKMREIGRCTYKSIEEKIAEIKKLGPISFNTPGQLVKVLHAGYEDILITGSSYIGVKANGPAWDHIKQLLKLEAYNLRT